MTKEFSIRQGSPILPLLQIRPEDLAYCTWNYPRECYAGTEEAELQISHRGNSNTDRYNCKCNHLGNINFPSKNFHVITTFWSGPSKPWLIEVGSETKQITLAKETFFLYQIYSARTIVGVTAILAIW